MEMKKDLILNSLLFGKQIERVNNKRIYKNKFYIYIYKYKLFCTLNINYMNNWCSILGARKKSDHKNPFVFELKLCQRNAPKSLVILIFFAPIFHYPKRSET